MSITGKRNHTIKKADLTQQRSAAVGFRKIVFFHKAAAGDTTINLGALSLPSEISSAGYTNPSPSELASLNLSLIRSNLKLISSRGIELMPGLSYTASGLTITLSDSYGPALAEEIFTGWIDPVAKTGANFVDADPLVSTGDLLAGVQDYNVGQPFQVNKYPNSQVGAVLVFVDGVLQYRNVGNATADPGADGNYQELAATGGTLATIIRFNEVDNDDDRSIMVVSNGLLSERPSESVKADLERVQGQVDKVVETLAAVAGVPESTFQAAPNSVDLKQFGDRVLDMESNRARIDLSNIWTAIQGFPGRTDGSSVPTGQVGERIVVFDESISRSVGNTQNAYMDVPSTSWNLNPGIWMFVAQGSLQIDNVTGGAAGDGLIGSIAIRTVANVVVAETVVATANLNLARGFGSAPVIGFVNILTTTGYKMSVFLRTISAAVSVSGSLIRGDHQPTRVIAVRIG